MYLYFAMIPAQGYTDFLQEINLWNIITHYRLSF
jgi:hypothetical protein